MKRVLLTLICLALGTCLRAQDVTITLLPGWNWISYDRAESMSIVDALGDFAPMEGDVINSQTSFTSYVDGKWRGSLQSFTPGLGYLYFSSRSEVVSFVFGGANTVTVTTSEPTNITPSSFTGGGEVNDSGNSAIIVHGLCWGTEPNPTVTGLHTIEGIGTGVFNTEVDGLEMNTTYYLRAYALTEKSMVYGEEKTFSTLTIPTYTIIVSANLLEGGTVSGGGTYEQGQSCSVTATANSGYVFTNWTENGEMVFTDTIYTFTVQDDRTLVANFTASSGDDHAYVDLGLPSGLLWATCNIGANTPEDYGDYFAWGETQPKGTYNWTTYQYCNGSNNTLTKYCSNSSCGYNGFTDNLTTLLPEDDAVTANWGGGWRMPTKEEWGELINNTTVTWTMQNGVSGRLFTASNGNSLFLPAAGYRYNNSLYSDGGDGDYWSSTLDTDGPSRAWSFDFYSDYYGMGYSGRYYGRSVRAVRSGQNVQSYTINVSAIPSDGGNVSGGGTYEQGQSCTVTATANSGYVFINWTENGEVVSTDAAYSFALTGNRNLLANFTASSGDDHAYVDLGLPSGTLWATCNVGANAPEEYGDYFAWGETQPKDYYGWETYQYCNGSYNTLTKYCNNSNYGNNGFTDNLTALLPEDDDAATANWGSEWRMPTKEEWEELYNNTTCIWTIQNGVNGLLFTVSNGDCLFLPAAGCRYSSNLYYAGSRGYYW